MTVNPVNTHQVNRGLQHRAGGLQACYLCGRIIPLRYAACLDCLNDLAIIERACRWCATPLHERVPMGVEICGACQTAPRPPWIMFVQSTLFISK